MRLLLDLDNTLVDRDAAFSRWAAEAISAAGGGAAQVQRLLAADAHGYAPRAQVLPVLREVLRAEELDEAALREMLMMDHVARVRPAPGVLEQLARARRRGIGLIAVTNGTSAQQRAKIDRTGLAPLLDRIVISEEVGVAKPDEAIFRTALEGLVPDAGTWMLGDHARSDIGGGRGAGLRTGWVAHGRPWDPADGPLPDAVAPSCTELLARVIDA